MNNRKINPNYYRHGKIECIDYIEDQNLGFHLGNAIKYIVRAGKKEGETIEDDLKKAIYYINRYIELQKKKEEEENKDKLTTITLNMEGKLLDERFLDNFSLTNNNSNNLIINKKK